MRQIDADVFDGILCDAEIEATKQKKHVLAGAINTIRGNMAEQPTVGGWIPCSERLPEEGGRYIVTGKSKCWWEDDWEYFTDVAASYGDYIDGFWDTFIDWGEGQEVHIIAWMSLPEPWKGGDDEESV